MGENAYAVSVSSMSARHFSPPQGTFYSTGCEHYETGMTNTPIHQIPLMPIYYSISPSTRRWRARFRDSITRPVGFVQSWHYDELSRRLNPNGRYDKGMTPPTRTICVDYPLMPFRVYQRPQSSLIISGNLKRLPNISGSIQRWKMDNL